MVQLDGIRFPDATQYEFKPWVRMVDNQELIINTGVGVYVLFSGDYPIATGEIIKKER